MFLTCYSTFFIKFYTCFIEFLLHFVQWHKTILNSTYSYNIKVAYALPLSGNKNNLIYLYYIQCFRNQTNQLVKPRDGNGAGHFGYPPRPAPNGVGYYFFKRVWDGFGIFFETRGGFGAGSGIAPPRPAPPRLYIKLKLKLNLI